MKQQDYDELREGLVEAINDPDMLFATVNEAVEMYDPADGNRDLQDRLATDPVVLRAFRKRIIRERAELRVQMLRTGKSGKQGADKMAKAAMDMMADDMEWARLNGKSFKQLTVGETEHVAPIQIISPDVNKLTTPQLRQLLAQRTAEEVETEEKE